jgi:hypothetical protein
VSIETWPSHQRPRTCPCGAGGPRAIAAIRARQLTPRVLHARVRRGCPEDVVLRCDELAERGLCDVSHEVLLWFVFSDAALRAARTSALPAARGNGRLGALGPAVDGARPMLHRTENAKEHADLDKSGRRGNGDGGGRRRSRSSGRGHRRRCGHRQATIIVMEIMLLLIMIRLIWLIPGIMRRLTHSN